MRYTDVDYYNLLAWAKANGYSGLGVIGDVHNMADKLRAAVAYAKKHNLFIVFLGDIIDYGPDPVGVVEIVYDLLQTGRAILVMGNHEYKYKKILVQLIDAEQNLRPRDRSALTVKFSHGTVNTFDVVEALPKDQRDEWGHKFSFIQWLSGNYFWLGDLCVTHGAYHHAMETNVGISPIGGIPQKFALYGQVAGMTVDDTAKYELWLGRYSMFSANHEVEKFVFDPELYKKPVIEPNPDEYPTRVYNWIDEVPEGKIVMVGHDYDRMVDGKPFMTTGKNGGTVVFVDTGCGKGGKLSLVPVSFDMEIGEVVQF